MTGKKTKNTSQGSGRGGLTGSSNQSTRRSTPPTSKKQVGEASSKGSANASAAAIDPKELAVDPTGGQWRPPLVSPDSPDEGEIPEMAPANEHAPGQEKDMDLGNESSRKRALQDTSAEKSRPAPKKSYASAASKTETRIVRLIVVIPKGSDDYKNLTKEQYLEYEDKLNNILFDSDIVIKIRNIGYSGGRCSVYVEDTNAIKWVLEQTNKLGFKAYGPNELPSLTTFGAIIPAAHKRVPIDKIIKKIQTQTGGRITHVSSFPAPNIPDRRYLIIGANETAAKSITDKKGVMYVGVKRMVFTLKKKPAPDTDEEIAQMTNDMDIEEQQTGE